MPFPNKCDGGNPRSGKLGKPGRGLNSIQEYYFRDYYDNTSALKIDRGHLLPNGVANQDALLQRTTFTLNNVAPQHSKFNQVGWNQLEWFVKYPQ